MSGISSFPNEYELLGGWAILIATTFQGQDEESEADPLDIVNCEGCFWVTIVGTIVAAFIVLFEYFIYMLQVVRKSKLSFVEVFKREFKVYLDFNSESKPVLTKDDLSEHKSTSDSVQENKSKSISKSRSKSRSMSPRRRMSKSKSRRSTNSKSNGNKSPLPYGFIYSRSTERLNTTP